MNWVEITTKIGCKNMCVYCPQTKFINSYKDDKKIMTLKDFIEFLKNINPLETKIHFSGFSESMLNDESVDMMVHAYRSGFGLVLYTTLVGFTIEKAEKLKTSEIVFEQTRLHEFVGNGFNKDIFNNLVNIFETNVSSKDHKIVRVDNPMSRGGNVFDPGYRFGRIRCHENRFFNNVLLPNGDLYLCCSDWSLQHRIGNLRNNHYSCKEFQEARINVIKMCDEYQSNVICRKCEWSYNV